MDQNVPDETYIELVRSLFGTLSPTIIMTISFVIVSIHLLSITLDVGLGLLLALCVAAAACRIAVLLLHRKTAASATLDYAGAVRLEAQFAVSYLMFAILFGVFSARAFWIVTSDLRALVVGLLFGYSAGVAAGISYRPRISIAAMSLAVMPTMVTAACMATVNQGLLAALLAIFSAGGIQSMIGRYKVAASSITMRRHHAQIAHTDPLTGMANRLGLQQCFEILSATSGRKGRIALHCIDLDRFKPVNDLYGHPIGDRLLCAVAQRLKAVTEESGIAARVGGDEFVIVQAAIMDQSQVELMARRIVRSIARPFCIDGIDVTIGTSVGFALSNDTNSSLDSLIQNADLALLAAKRRGGGAVNWDFAAEVDMGENVILPMVMANA